MADNVAGKGTVEKVKTGPSIRIIGAIAMVAAIVLAVFSFIVASNIMRVNQAAEEAEQRYVDCTQAVEELGDASDDLTSDARLFVIAGRMDALIAYITEIEETDRRGNAVKKLKESLEDDAAVIELENALASSDNLAQRELKAMRLAADYYGLVKLPDKLRAVNLTDEEKAASADSKLKTAQEMVLGKGYDETKEIIVRKVAASADVLLEELNVELQQSEQALDSMLLQLRVAVSLLLCVILLLVLAILLYVLKPLRKYIDNIKEDEPFEPTGSHELHYLAEAYNTMYQDNVQHLARLRAEAERDALTGISNRRGFDAFLASHTRNVALVIIDIDHFKNFNNAYGHDTGDAVLVKMARTLGTVFRTTDFPCRIGDDEFAIVMTNVSPELRDAISAKVGMVSAALADDADGLPIVNISAGIAFSSEGMNDADILQAADSALYMVEQNGANGYAFNGDDWVSKFTVVGN